MRGVRQGATFALGGLFLLVFTFIFCHFKGDLGVGARVGIVVDLFR